jgi:mRNA interferase RelE/StbE
LAYKIIYVDTIEKDLKRVDRKQQERILDAVRNELAEAPRKVGEPLKGKFKGLWKMYVRPYRVIFEILDHDEAIRIHKIGHRKDVYR